MHKKKITNKKIISIILGGLVAVSATSTYIYANELEIKNDNSINLNEGEDSNTDDNNDDVENGEGEDEEDEENVINVNLNDVGKEENLGKKVKVVGLIDSINGNIVIIKDGSGKAGLVLNNISVENISVGNNITAIGNIEDIDNIKYVVVYNSSDIEIKSNEDDNNKDNDDEKDNNSNENDSNNNDKPTDDKEVNKNPESNNQSSNNTKPNQSISGNVQLEGSSSQNNITSNSIKKVYARSYTYISTDLTSAQWKKVKTAIEEGSVKVVDLPNNKIRIKQVSNGYGDKVWIVNDPRGLDEEVEDTVKTIGLNTMQSLSYKDYDITESSWSAIIEDIKEGSAKVKLTNDGILKVIYNKSDKSDTVKTIEKL